MVSTSPPSVNCVRLDVASSSLSWTRTTAFPPASVSPASTVPFSPVLLPYQHSLFFSSLVFTQICLYHPYHQAPNPVPPGPSQTAQNQAPTLQKPIISGKRKVNHPLLVKGLGLMSSGRALPHLYDPILTLNLRSETSFEPPFDVVAQKRQTVPKTPAPST